MSTGPSSATTRIAAIAPGSPRRNMMACARPNRRPTRGYRRIEGIADMKPHLFAAAYLVGALSASPALAGKPDREQTTWAGECIIFKTPTAGSVPCDMTSPKITLTDGKSYRFDYVNAEGNDRRIYFVNDPRYYDTTPVVPGIFRVTDVEDNGRPRHASVDGRGSCDTRSGFIRCEVTADLGEYVIIYRIVEESEHLICPPPADVPHEVGDVCATTYSPAEARKVRWDKWEQTVWSANCETFQTPWAGIVPCDKAEPEFTITSTHNDGSVSFGFEYGLHEADWGGRIFFETKAPVEPGVYPIEEVQDEVRYPSKTQGSCDMRGGKIRCISGDPGEQIIIAYRLISEKQHCHRDVLESDSEVCDH